MKIIPTVEYDVVLYNSWDQYYNTFQLKCIESGVIEIINTGKNSTFTQWYKYTFDKSINQFFVIVNKNGENHIRNPYGKEWIKIKELYPEYFI